MATLPFQAWILYEGLWCLADREGRLEDRPKYIKAEIFPYNKVDVEKLLDLLTNPGIIDRPEKVFIRRYIVSGSKYIDIPAFLEHQRPHHTEQNSKIPSFNGALTVKSPLLDCSSPEGREGKGREGKGKEGECERKHTLSSRTPISDKDFFQALKTNPAYQGVDIDRELAKMDVWFLTPKGRGRKKTHKFIFRWLNKCDREIQSPNEETAEDKRAEREKETKERKQKILEAEKQGEL